MIVLIAAVPLETELLRLGTCPVRGAPLRRAGALPGDPAGQGVALQHSGVGKANAAATAALLLDSLDPEAVICFGCAGAYLESNLRVGDLVLASEEIYGDEGAVVPEGFLAHQASASPWPSAAASTGSTAFRSIPNCWPTASG